MFMLQHPVCVDVSSLQEFDIFGEEFQVHSTIELDPGLVHGVLVDSVLRSYFTEGKFADYRSELRIYPFRLFHCVRMEFHT